MTDTQTNLKEQGPSPQHDYFRGISATLIFLCTLGALATPDTGSRAICIAAASVVGGIAVAAYSQKKSKE